MFFRRLGLFLWSFSSFLCWVRLVMEFGGGIYIGFSGVFHSADYGAFSLELVEMFEGS